MILYEMKKATFDNEHLQQKLAFSVSRSEEIPLTNQLNEKASFSISCYREH